MRKRAWITILVILIVVIISYAVLNRAYPDISEETAKCIGQNSTLYVQLGCHACETQEEMFGGKFQYLNTIDCWFYREKCSGITAIPTWIIKEQKYLGVQSIEKLKELTGC